MRRFLPLLFLSAVVSLAVGFAIGVSYNSSRLKEQPVRADFKPSLPDAGIAPVKVYFSHDEKIANRLKEAISQAKSTIDIAIFDMDSEPIAWALCAKKENVKIRIVMDRRQSGQSDSQYRFLKANRLMVRRIGGKKGGIMHNKMAIFDDNLVMTGSYNFTGGAEENNYENAIFIMDKKIVRQYQEVFETLWNKAKE